MEPQREGDLKSAGCMRNRSRLSENEATETEQVEQELDEKTEDRNGDL